jgi:hypothetical protein
LPGSAASFVDGVGDGPEEHGSRGADRLDVTRKIKYPRPHDIEREREAWFAWLTHTLSLPNSYANRQSAIVCQSTPPGVAEA